MAEHLFAGNAVLMKTYAQAAWQPTRLQQRNLQTAGMLVARVFGEALGPYEAVPCLDEPEPQTMDEALVLLLAEQRKTNELLAALLREMQLQLRLAAAT